MLRLSKLTDYAFVVLAHLARHGDGCVHPVSAIAEATGVPQPTAAKVLKILAQAGLVVSTRGVHGGYGLARDPAGITAVDVLSAMDGPLALLACVHASGETCADAERCQLAGHWQRINEAVRDALRSVTLLELASPPAREPAARTTPNAPLGS